MGIPLGVICCFSLAAFNICSLCLIFANLINMCLGVFLLGFILFGTLWVSWTWVIISFPILGKFSTIISSSIFSWSFFLSSSSQYSSVQSLNRVQLFATLCYPMNRSTPGLPVHHQLPEFTQTHVHRVSNAIQPSHPLSSPSPAYNLSQHQGLF